MIKQDEKDFAKQVLSFGKNIPSELWDTLTKRQYSLLSKWTDKGIWNYGVSVRSGWIEDREKLQRIANDLP